MWILKVQKDDSRKESEVDYISALCRDPRCPRREKDLRDDHQKIAETLRWMLSLVLDFEEFEKEVKEYWASGAQWADVYPRKYLEMASSTPDSG
jgi:hypothetical protein